MSIDHQAENALLLGQIKQLEAELEHYFLEVNRHHSIKSGFGMPLSYILPARSNSVAGLDIRELEGRRISLWRAEGFELGWLNIGRVEFNFIVSDSDMYLQILEIEDTNLDAKLSGTRNGDVSIPVHLNPEISRARSDSRITDIHALSTSYLLLVCGAMSLVFIELGKPNSNLSEHFSPVEMRYWRSKASDASRLLSNNVSKEFHCDNVWLKATEHQADYEQIWLAIENLMISESIYDLYDFKLEALEMRGDKGDWKYFSRYLRLELRNCHDGLAPLRAWPPTESDKYGYHLRIRFDLHSNSVDLGQDTLLSAQDLDFLCTLIRNISTMAGLLDHRGDKLKRNWRDWLESVSAAYRILESVKPKLGVL